ncbi:hypothetical protein ANA_C13485 [Anabaena sp. 90]|uniref:hypothetical protein n=1 Tax=Anabaena sp. 90 TaxID=46234 RepID=UPI00029B703F|nr:hypothetical protein [Anabaena sp. 90]AFW96147.1 hypothetical protein ANA_C13485 [Anabaena sp. 90]
MTPEELLNQISDGIWINKGGLKVPDDVVQALQQKEDWFDGLNPIVYSKDNLPDIKGILNFFSEQELDQEVGFAATEILQSCYGVNKVVNSKVHDNPQASGENKLDLLAGQATKPDDYTAAVEVNNLFMNWGNIVKSNYTNNSDDIFLRIKSIEETNKNWFQDKVDDLKAQVLAAYDNLMSQFDEQEDPVPQEVRNHFIAVRQKTEQNFSEAITDFPQDNDNLVNIFLELFNKLKEELNNILQQIKETIFGKDESKAAKAEAKQENKGKVDIIKFLKSKVIRPAMVGIRRLFTQGKKLVEFKDQANYAQDNLKSQFGSVVSNYGGITPLPTPTNLDVVNVLGKIAESLLSTFILKGISLPRAFFDAIKNTVVSVITKRLSIPASEAIRYITGGLLRTVKDLLPAVFNNTGMFAGAWGLLTACAPYILAAAIIIIIAINMAKKNQLGNFIWLLGIKEGRPEPDLGIARVSGDSLERMKDFEEFRFQFLEETNKQYQYLYALTFKSEKLGRSFDMTGETPTILSEEAAKIIHQGFSYLEDMPPY